MQEKTRERIKVDRRENSENTVAYQERESLGGIAEPTGGARATNPLSDARLN